MSYIKAIAPPMIAHPTLVLVAVFLLTNLCYSQHQQPLIAKNMDDSNEVKNNLLAFVGEKISAVQLPYEKGDFDLGFKARYKILQRVYGEFTGDTIEFESYDHYGTPPFLKYKNVLLFVSRDETGYYHEKYQFEEVYQTVDGRWAGAYSEEYEHAYNGNTSITPEKIPFVDRVTYPTTVKYESGMVKCIADAYPAPYFSIEGDSAVAAYGNYVEELFMLHKEGVLAARELFSKKPGVEENNGVGPAPEIRMALPLKKKDSLFARFTNGFFNALKVNDRKLIRQYMLDSIEACGRIWESGYFLDSSGIRILDYDFLNKVVSEGHQSHTSTNLGRDDLHLFAGRELKNKRKPRLFGFEVVNPRNALIQFFINLGFIETKNGYRLYSYYDWHDKTCPQ